MIHPSQQVRRDAVRYLTPQTYFVQEPVEGSPDNAMLAPQRNDVVFVYDKTNPDWWFAKHQQRVGWVPSRVLQSAAKEAMSNVEPAPPVTRGSPISAAQLDMGRTKFEVTMQKEYQYETTNITVYFITVQGVVKKGEPQTWMVCKTMRCFQRLKKSLEERLGQYSVPDLPDPRRPDNIAPDRWDEVKFEAVHEFLVAFAKRAELVWSEQFRNFLTSDMATTSGDVVNDALIQPLLRIWSMNSADPAPTEIRRVLAAEDLDPSDSENDDPVYIDATANQTNHALLHASSSDAVLGVDTSVLKTKRGRSKRSESFQTVTAMAAGASQRGKGFVARMSAIAGNVHMQRVLEDVAMLTAPDLSALGKPHSRRTTTQMYFATYNLPKDDDDGSDTRQGIEHLAYRSVTELNEATSRKARAMANDMTMKDRRRPSFRQWESLTRRVDSILAQRAQQESRKQMNVQLDTSDTSLLGATYKSERDGDIASYATQLSNLLPTTRAEIQRIIENRPAPVPKNKKSEASLKTDRMKYIESALANKRVLCSHVADLLQGLTDEDERTHLALFALQRLTDAVEAEEAGLWEALHLHPDIERRARLIVAALAAEASAEEVTREIKKTSVYADKKLQAVKHAVAAANKEVESLENSSGTRSSIKRRLDLVSDAVKLLESALLEVQDLIDPVNELVTQAEQESNVAAEVVVKLERLGTDVSSVCTSTGKTPSESETMIVQALTAAIEVAKKARMYAMSAAEKAAMDAFAIQATSQDIEGMHESIFDQSEMLQDRFDNTEDLGDEDWSQVGAWKEELAELSFRNYQKLRSESHVRMDKEPTRDDHIENTTLLCLLLARAPLLRDLKTLRENQGSMLPSGHITPRLSESSETKGEEHSDADADHESEHKQAHTVFTAHDSKWARRRYDIRRQTIQRSFGQRPTIGRNDLLKQTRRR